MLENITIFKNKKALENNQKKMNSKEKLFNCT